MIQKNVAIAESMIGKLAAIAAIAPQKNTLLGMGQINVYFVELTQIKLVVTVATAQVKNTRWLIKESECLKLISFL